MLCPICHNPARRFGKNRNGSQRWHCVTCNRTFTIGDERDRRRVPADRALLGLRLLLEGNSVRSTERITRTHRDTILRMVVDHGTRCAAFLSRKVRGVAVKSVECDEVWSFIGCKEKTRVRLNYPESVGDCYTWTALERFTKLLLAYHVGKRTPESARAFSGKLAVATAGRFQVTTDGFRPYRTALPNALPDRIDYAMLIKTYGTEPGEERRYSPPVIIDVDVDLICGDPDPILISTSFVERHNKTLRMQIRRFTRLTDGHSKKWENHESAIALFLAYYNFCRVHSTLTEATWTEEIGTTKTTPAMAAGLTDHPWTVEEMLLRASE